MTQLEGIWVAYGYFFNDFYGQRSVAAAWKNPSPSSIPLGSPSIALQPAQCWGQILLICPPLSRKVLKKAGPELCQAQDKLSCVILQIDQRDLIYQTDLPSGIRANG